MGAVCSGDIPVVPRVSSSWGSADDQGVFWLWDNWNPPVKTAQWYLMAAWSVFVVVSGLFFMGAGVSRCEDTVVGC